MEVFELPNYFEVDLRRSPKIVPPGHTDFTLLFYNPSEAADVFSLSGNHGAFSVNVPVNRAFLASANIERVVERLGPFFEKPHESRTLLLDYDGSLAPPEKVAMGALTQVLGYSVEHCLLDGRDVEGTYAFSQNNSSGRIVVELTGIRSPTTELTPSQTDILRVLLGYALRVPFLD